MSTVTGRILAIARVVTALLVLALFVALFAFAGCGIAKSLGWLPRTQFVPAVLFGSFAIAGAILLITAIFGRLYCSMLCPLGILQDIFGAIFRRKRSWYQASSVEKWLRYGIFAICAIGSVFGFRAMILEPYGIFGRALTSWRAPYGDVAIVTMSVSLAMIVAILLGTLWRKRLWCNTVCPVGTLLGLISAFAPFRVRIDAKKCIGCGHCAEKCNAGCISGPKPAKIAPTDCIACGKCLAVCPVSAISIKKGKSENDQ